MGELLHQQFIGEFEQFASNYFDNLQSALAQPMRYAFEGGGKRVRPRLVRLGAGAVSAEVDEGRLMPVALAVEFVHTYSLIHDDLPCMDNDDYRRGRLTVHKRFGEATAVLAGDMLLTLAAEQLSTCPSGVAKHVMDCAAQMVEGQMQDLAHPQDESAYLRMYAQKTSALFIAAIGGGAICAGAQADGELVRTLCEYAHHLGLAFQLADDLLDADENSLLSLIGEQGARRLLEEHTQLAKNCAVKMANSAELICFAEQLLERKH